MKRVGLIGVCFGMILLLTGCGNEVELTCTMEESASYVTSTQQYHFVYADEELVTMDQGVMIEVDDSYSYMNSYLSNLTEDFEEELDDYVSELGQDVVDGDVNADGNRFTASMSYNVNRMSTDQLDYIAYEEEFANYEGAKAYLEDQGYTCK